MEELGNNIACISANNSPVAVPASGAGLQGRITGQDYRAWSHLSQAALQDPLSKFCQVLYKCHNIDLSRLFQV